MKMKKVFVISLMIIWVAGLIFCGFAELAPAAAPVAPIKIGALLELTGWSSAVGIPCKEGIELKLEEVRSVAGRPIEVIYEDQAADPNLAMDKARKLVERDKVSAVLGPVNGGVCMAIGPYLAKMKIPSFSISPSPDKIAMLSEWMYSPIGTLRGNTMAAGAYAADELKAKTAIILSRDDIGGREFAQGFIDAFKERGGKILQDQWWPPGTTDFSTYILGMKQADIAAIWIATNFTGPFFKQYAELGKLPAVIDIYSTMDFQENIQSAGTTPAKVGAVALESWVWSEPEAKSQEFTARFRKKFGKDPAHFALLAYDCATILLNALEKTKGNTTPEVLRAAIDQTDLDTAYGRRMFTERLGVSNPRIYKLVEKDGKLVFELKKKYRVRYQLSSDKKAIISTFMK
jgi:branched-chain amino acid transport system substrate-binding protein